MKTQINKTVSDGLGGFFSVSATLHLSARKCPTFRKFHIILILMQLVYVYTPDIRSMWGYIVFAFPFVRSFVRTYVRSFVRTFVRSFVFPSQGQSFCVKVYKTSYFEDSLMDFIHIWHEGRYRSKVFISTIPTPG